MNDGRRRCSGSLSCGFALTRIVILVVAAVVLFFAVRSCFPSREERLLRFLDDGRQALADGREADFFAGFAQDVRYQNGALKELQRDWKRYQSAGIGAPRVVKQETKLDDTGADVRLDVVFVVELRPVAQAAVTMRAEDADGTWRVTSLGWK